jgi:hypothetical protein
MRAAASAMVSDAAAVTGGWLMTSRTTRGEGIVGSFRSPCREGVNPATMLSTLI